MSAKEVCKISVLYIIYFLFYVIFCTWTQIPILSDSSVESAVKILDFFKTKEICMPKNRPKKLKLSTAFFKLSKGWFLFFQMICQAINLFLDAWIWRVSCICHEKVSSLSWTNAKFHKVFKSLSKLSNIFYVCFLT